MSNPRISTATLRQLIQLQVSGLSTRKTALALNLSQGAVSKYRGAVLAVGLTWEEALKLEEAELERRVWQVCAMAPRRSIVLPDCAWVHTELKRHKHVTLHLLWEEYQAALGRTALRYSAFCDRYRQWAKRLRRSMRQRHFAGEKLFVDYAGRAVPIYGASGEDYRASLFVGALGASGYAYAEATRTAALPDWLGSHVRMLEYYGASPTILVPDNPRVGVTKADRYEPELQRSYEEMAAHFGIAVIPARPYRPRDKAKAELTVLLVCRWVLARLRHQRFFSLEELNAAIRPLLKQLNEQAAPETARIAALDVRGARSPGDASAAEHALCLCRVETRARRLRLSRRYRGALLQRAARLRRAGAVGALQCGDGRGVPP